LGDARARRQRYLRTESAGLPVPRGVMEIHDAGLRQRASRERVPSDRDLAVKTGYELATVRPPYAA
jgi:hypothetical protein